MRPVQVSVNVLQPREVVYGYLDVLANHERYTDHLLKDWKYQGPKRGFRAKARVEAVADGRTDVIDLEAIEAEAPVRTAERNVDAGGMQVATGTYTLADLPAGDTRIAFEYGRRETPRSERLASPVVRTMIRRANRRSLRRLAEELQKLDG